MYFEEAQECITKHNQIFLKKFFIFFAQGSLLQGNLTVMVTWFIEIY